MSAKAIIEKIQKLFRLSQSPNEHEAALALEKARLLMLEHNISEAQLNTENPQEEIIELNFQYTHTNEKWTLRLCYWLGRAFNLRVIQTKRNIGDTHIEFEKYIKFIGKKADVEVAKYVMGYILYLLDVASEEYLSFMKSKSAIVKSSYKFGFITAVCEKLARLEQEALAAMAPSEVTAVNALVVSTNALVTQYVKDTYGDKPNEGKESSVKLEMNHYKKGFDEGEKHGIYRGVENSSTPKPQNISHRT